MRNAPALHGRDHLPGGSDPIPQFGILGATTQEIFLPSWQSNTNNDTNGPGWTSDINSYGGGYITRGIPQNGDYFSFMHQFSPKGSIWQFQYLYWVGPDYGKVAVSMSSLAYEGSERLGCVEGKIQDFAAAGFGPALNYIPFVGFTQDCYAAVEAQQASGFFQFIPGGEPGDPMTDLSITGGPCVDEDDVDPQSGAPISDGGPGWYRTKMYVDGKNASSTGYRMRISRVVWMRVDDLYGI